MTKYQLTIIVVLYFLISACESSKPQFRIEGDLYFGYFRLGSYYNQPDSIIDKARQYFDTVNYENASDGDRYFIDLYKIVSSNDLIYKPYVDLLIQPDSIVKLYLDISDYDKIKIYKRKDLQDNNEKIVINASVIDYSNGILYCDTLLNIRKVNGKTFQIQKKFRIDDYE